MSRVECRVEKSTIEEQTSKILVDLATLVLVLGLAVPAGFVWASQCCEATSATIAASSDCCCEPTACAIQQAPCEFAPQVAQALRLTQRPLSDSRAFPLAGAHRPLVFARMDTLEWSDLFRAPPVTIPHAILLPLRL